jgi:hypothetical protein
VSWQEPRGKGEWESGAKLSWATSTVNERLAAELATNH